MKPTLHSIMEALHRQQDSDVFVLQIGAMDGKTFDPVYPFITRYGWRGLIVEPVAEHFAMLKETYAAYENVQLAQVAIGERDGTANMFRVRETDVKAGRVPTWGSGLASFYRDRNALSFQEVVPYVIEEQVPCLTLRSLLEQHGVDKVDVLQIDTEGHDYQVLRQFDFTRYAPHIINLEFVNLPQEEQQGCYELLTGQGYNYSKAGYDLLAVPTHFTAAAS